MTDHTTQPPDSLHKRAKPHRTTGSPHGTPGESDRAESIFSDIMGMSEAGDAIRRNAERLKAVVEILQYRADSVQDFLDYALDKAIALTRSKFGYIYFYDENLREFILNTWSKDVMKECAVADPKTRYDLDKTGIWGEAVRQRKPIVVNDFQADSPLKKGYPKGHVRLTRFLTVPIFHNGRIVAVVGMANKSSDYSETDTLELTLLMESVWKSVENMRSEGRIVLLGEMLDEAPASITIHDTDGRFLFANRATLSLHGYDRHEEFLAINLHDLDVSESEALLAERFRSIAEMGEARFEVAHYRKDGSIFPLEVSAKAIQWHGEPAILSIAADISDRKQAEEERAKLQAQLAQAQKMESVGRLAGGVAHDFNNMLAVILGQTEMALMKVPPTESLHRKLLQIQQSAERSVVLVRQLLAFARKQTVAPVLLDLNDRVGGMLKMLRRLIGEDIDLVWVPGAELWPLKMDPSQIDQILANLCVNARDAIADVGKITIETRNVSLEADSCARRAECVPGPYVLLSVSDDGCGMGKEVLEKLFEPFFTTKAVGRGTGLGLATVYGIVKQNKGFIDVYSEPGQGTTFRVYLPRHEGEAGEASRQGPVDLMRGGGETILLVEDEPMLLEIGKSMLERLGYRVLAAGMPGEAVQAAEAHPHDIHLLMTDVVMPGMNGRELSERLLSLYPDLRCLFMSGYTSEVIAHHGVLDAGVPFIQKPFTLQTLSTKLREVLE